MSLQKIAIITDSNPSKNPGASMVAGHFANEAAKAYPVELWTSYMNPEPQTEEVFPILTLPRRLSSSHTNPRGKALREVLGFQALFWVVTWFIRFRPSVVWIHQIGNIFPLTTAFVLSHFQTRVVWTLHDFNLVVPRKLFPRDVLPAETIEQIDNEHLDIQKVTYLTFQSYKTKLQAMLRIHIIRLLVKRVDLFCISEMQRHVLETFGFKIRGVIANGSSICTCSNVDDAKPDEFLFAGRLIGKGLEIAVDHIKSNPLLRLNLAGPTELNDFASTRLPMEQITYHGQLDSANLFSIIHKCRFVFVMSECFDVFPSIVLEAIRHGSFPITSRWVGNSTLSTQIHPTLTARKFLKTSHQDVVVALEQVDVKERLAKLSLCLPTFHDAFELYQQYFIAEEKES